MKHLEKIDNSTIKIPADIQCWEELENYMSKEFERNNVPKDKIMKTLMAVEEIFVNIAHYAYHPSKGFVWIKNFVSENMYHITFIDEGEPYNPLEKADPDITLDLDDREIGGLGIFMVKNITDKVDYHHIGNQNQFTIGIKVK